MEPSAFHLSEHGIRERPTPHASRCCRKLDSRGILVRLLLAKFRNRFRPIYDPSCIGCEVHDSTEDHCRIAPKVFQSKESPLLEHSAPLSQVSRFHRFGFDSFIETLPSPSSRIASSLSKPYMEPKPAPLQPRNRSQPSPKIFLLTRSTRPSHQTLAHSV